MRFLERLQIIRQKYKDAKFFVAKPLYNNGSPTLIEDNQYLADHFLPKNSLLVWEDEYRFICAIPKLSINEMQPIIVKSVDALVCIESYNQL